MKNENTNHSGPRHRSETPNIPYGPATGVPAPAPRNEALSTGPDHEYRKDSTPGTADHAEPRHVAGGPGHANCDHERGEV